MTPFDRFVYAVRVTSPRLAVVLGSGLGAVPHDFQVIEDVAFSDVEGLARPSVAGHVGRIELGRCLGRPLLVFRGRLHLYEGHAPEQVVEPIRLADRLGIRTLLLTNAAGGIHPNLVPGELMAIEQHLPLQGRDAWKRSAAPSPYSPALLAELRQREADLGRTLLAGTYAAVTGPSYETPAEIRAFRSLRADAVGMSTALEAEEGARLGLEVAAVSCITNWAAGLTPEKLSHAEVLAHAARAAERISEIVGHMARNWG